ncbi:uncharacterized protein LOC111642837 [Copidosoma floridanum]|uniref:uncharacterized protein LOC111642837 n=1 Tax=Copidosoma floridanum TaxID=29053 RepID=UPI000C6FBBF2|nr:uncharacterized protein LOC111642837 [Copidosoma floridanum]
MKDYESLGHMSPVSVRQPEPKQVAYIPHHPVVRDDSYKRIRIVFNASRAKTKSALCKRAQELESILSSAGMELDKWASNSCTLLSRLSPKTLTSVELPTHADALASVLGMLWAPESHTMLFKSLWLHGLDWDQALPPSITRLWQEFPSELPRVSQLRISRWIRADSSSQWELHGFCDASEKAYAAAVYAVVHNKSTPRASSTVHCWSDSQIVLAWLRGHPSRWKTYVAHRTSEIYTLIPQAIWHHVVSREKLADCASKGVSIDTLETSTLWWHGPCWITESPDIWPTMPLDPSTELEKRSTSAFLTINAQDKIDWNEWLSRFSSIQKLIRILSYNTLKPLERRLTWLLVRKIHVGRVCLWRLVQRLTLHDEIQSLSNSEEVRSSSCLKRLNPFLDILGLIRVGGRLHKAALTETEKHPIVLPAKHHVVRLLVRDTHLFILHGGPLLTHSTLNRQFWILRARNLVRGIVRSCTTCARFKARTISQMMGVLPAPRTQPSRPFTHTGVDYAGPFWFKASPSRGRKVMKGYIAVFVCLATKATHIEVVSDYSTPAFLAAFRRFVSRRGLCLHMYSDNGTTFQGADAELSRLFEETSAVGQQAASSLASEGVSWHFTPPYAPNFGGLWESTVKACKHHLKRVIGEALLTYEELTTLMSQIETRKIDAVGLLLLTLRQNESFLEYSYTHQLKLKKYTNSVLKAVRKQL